MWKCPKCGKEFARQNQDHYCVRPKNVDEYIAAQDEGIYPGEEATAAFADELSDCSVSKGTIRLPYDMPLPAELIEKIAKWCYENYSK